MAAPPRFAYRLQTTLGMPIASLRPAVRRVGYALGAAVAWLPLWAAFALPTTAFGRTALVGFALLSALTPASALLVLAAFVTIADVVTGQALFGAGALRGVEALVLAFLGGWFLSNAILPRPIPPSSRGVRAAAAILTALIVCSLVVTIAGFQARSTFPAEYAQDFFRFITTTYLSGPGDLVAVMQGAWLLEGVALFFAARACSVGEVGRRDACVRMLIVGGAAAGALTIERLVRALLTQLNPAEVFELVVTGQWRLPGHVMDTNAAGSGFVMAAVLALGYLAATRRRALAWTAVLGLIVSGSIISASRSAIVAGLAVVFAFGVLFLRRRASRRMHTAAVVALVGVTIVAAGILTFAPNLMAGEKGARSLMFRWYFTQTSARIIALEPVFGVGLGRFREVSTAHMPAPLREVYFAENAHNYFLQTGAELGLLGMIAFAGIVCAPVVRGLRSVMRGEAGLPVAGMVGAALVFLITTLSGHPFLTIAVAFPFWIVLGLCEGEIDRTTRAASPEPRASGTRPAVARPAVLLVAVLGAIVLSLPHRVQRELRYVDFSNVAYGVFDWEESDAGFRYRWTGPRARFFVTSNARLVELPVRALHFDPSHRETAVTIALDGREANRIVLSDANWRAVRLLIPSGRGRRFRQIDLTVSPTWSPARVSPDWRDQRELGVIVGELRVRRAVEPDP